MITRILVAATVAFVSAPDAKAQEVPPIVMEALAARQTPFCWGVGSELQIRRDTVAYFPALTAYVARCEMYFGLPSIVAVALDTTGLLYLLDSQANMRMIEARYGRPSLDTANVIDYVMTAAKLEGLIDWDAVLVTDSAHPDPRRLAPTYPTEGDCSTNAPYISPYHRDGRAWDVVFDVTGYSSIERVSALVLERVLAIQVETRCGAMHAN